MDNYMRAHNINTDLKGRAIKYLEFTWEAESKNLEKENDLLEQLPQSLKKEILFESNKKSLLHFKILKNNFNEEVMNKLSSSLQPLRFSPNEIIYSKGEFDPNNPSLYLIIDGKKNQFFGEFEFFSNRPYQDTAKSVSFTILYKISLKNFLQILKSVPDQYENFCCIRDKITLYNDYSPLYSACISCGGQSHNFYKCPFITHVPKKSFIIERFNFSKPQIRQPFLRKKNFQDHVRNFRKNRLGVFKIRFNSNLMSFFRTLCPIQTLETSDQEKFKKTSSKDRMFLRDTITSLSLQSFRDLKQRDDVQENFFKSWNSAEIIRNPSQTAFSSESGELLRTPTKGNLTEPTTKAKKFENVFLIKAREEKGKISGASSIQQNSLDSAILSRSRTINETEIMTTLMRRKAVEKDKENMSVGNEEKAKISGNSFNSSEMEDAREKNSWNKSSSINERDKFRKKAGDGFAHSSNNKTRKMENIDEQASSLEEKQVSDYEIKKVESFCASNLSHSLVKNGHSKQNSSGFYLEKGNTLKGTKQSSTLGSKKLELSKEEKHQNLFDYDFENFGSFTNYFSKGDCKNGVQKLTRRSRMRSPRKLGLGSPNFSAGMRTKRRNNVLQKSKMTLENNY